MKKTLFLSPPSFDGFDGGAGSRYQAKREITSYWFPTWLAQPAAMVPGSKLVDAAPHHQSVDDVLKIAKDYELVIMHTSTPSLANDIKCAETIKAQNPDTKVGLIGAHVAVLPEQTLREAPIIDFVCRHEFDYTCLAWGPNTEYVLRYFGAVENGGSLGVLIFFSISGYLITQSFIVRGGNLKSFLLARALRIYPALIAATLFSMVLASFATTVPFHQFVTDHMTRRFLLHNSMGYPTEYYLPGAFATNPSAGIVNGALWTLPIEMEMYLVIAMLGVLGLFGSREWFNTFFAAFIVLVCTVKLSDLPLFYNNAGEVPRMAIIFLFGAFFYINRSRVPVSIPWAILLVAAIIHWHKAPNLRTIYLPALAYIIFVLAYHPKLYFAAFNRLGDYSYGLYVFAFPTQQLFSYYNPGIKEIPLLLLVYPCVLLTAILSWNFIEKPALKLKPQ